MFRENLLQLRKINNLSQEELAEKVHVTRQAVSRWETGETNPNIDTLKHLSKLFDVSINTLLGFPRELICQCCGMPLNDDILSKEPDGLYNEEYCQWCYMDGHYVYTQLDDLIETCIKKNVTDPEKLNQIRSNLKELNYWKRYESLGGQESFNEYKTQLIHEINELRIIGMPEITSLNTLSGHYINLNYRLPNGQIVQFLDSQTMYLANQVPCEYCEEVCFGIVASMDFILICSYEQDGTNPELLLYKKR